MKEHRNQKKKKKVCLSAYLSLLSIYLSTHIDTQYLIHKQYYHLPTSPAVVTITPTPRRSTETVLIYLHKNDNLHISLDIPTFNYLSNHKHTNSITQVVALTPRPFLGRSKNLPRTYFAPPTSASYYLAWVNKFYLAVVYLFSCLWNGEGEGENKKGKEQEERDGKRGRERKSEKDKDEDEDEEKRERNRVEAEGEGEE